MKRRLALIGGLLALLVCVFAARAARSDSVPTVAFRPLVIELTSDQEVAAYQLEITVTAGQSSFVGIEGGEAPFDVPPLYDPEALSNTRIILASFDTAEVLAAGSHRIATLHVREVGAGARYHVKVLAVANSAAVRVPATATIAHGERE